jgi:hypothetical protein
MIFGPSPTGAQVRFDKFQAALYVFMTLAIPTLL